MELVRKYFPDLSPLQEKQFALTYDLYRDWNEKINVISRKDMENFYERHILHSLAIAKVTSFKEGSRIMDVGTGGGFPGIPLAILFPQVNFTLVDSIGKKITVVKEVAKALDLENVDAYHERAEKIRGEFDFIVSRAVTEMKEFLRWTDHKISKSQKNKMRNGILYLKGGDLTEEFSGIRYPIKEYLISDFFKEDFFVTKKVIHVTI